MLNQDNTKNEVVKALIYLWGPLPVSQQKTFLDNMHIRKFAKGQIIYKDIDEPNRMKLLIYGKVKVFKMGIGGRNQIIRVVKPMQFFGFRAYFAEEPYMTSAMALEDSTIAYCRHGGHCQTDERQFLSQKLIKRIGTYRRSYR